MSRDPHSILGVNPDASEDEIKEAFRKKTKENHPDRGGEHDEFVLILWAYRELTDDEKNKISEDERRRNRALQILTASCEDAILKILKAPNNIMYSLSAKALNVPLLAKREIESALGKLREIVKSDKESIAVLQKLRGGYQRKGSSYYGGNAIERIIAEKTDQAKKHMKEAIFEESALAMASQFISEYVMSKDLPGKFQTEESEIITSYISTFS